MRRRATLLADPPASERTFTIISADDHLVEPADLFERYLPERHREAGPRIEVGDDGTEWWVFEGDRFPQIGLNAVVGRPPEEWTMDPANFSDMRRGCWDPEARIADMDLDGILASLCYPSLIAGFAGTMFARARDPELGRACVRAWNEWHLVEWCGAHPDRLIPVQLAWLNDVDTAAADVRANAERGFRAVSFVENPHDCGLPSLHTDHWDPFLRACEETGTVICLHNASSGWTASRSPGVPLELLTTLFPVNALVAAADWLWSGVLCRFPGLRVCLAESGIDWVPMLINRIDYVMEHSAQGQGGWPDPDHRPSDVLRRNVWFSVIDITNVISLRDHIGVDHIVLESDYPHADSTWPDTQARARRGLTGLPDDDIRRITWANAAALFRWDVPASLQFPASGEPSDPRRPTDPEGAS
jgi:predicted TIM-barrel fold metal-dependent hydrolase